MHMCPSVDRVQLRLRDAREKWMAGAKCRSAGTVRRNCARQQRIVSGVVHAEWLPHARAQKLIERHSGNALDDQPGEHEIPVAVNGGITRSIRELPGIDLPQER